MKYWVYMNGEVPGSYAPQELAALPGFSMTTLVCPAEGEILEKNWRRSGEFDEIIRVLHERDASRPPSTPPQDQFLTADVNKLLDTAGARLFSHVADLMKELENRREERALLLSLQRQLLDVKEQLQKARDSASALESRMPRLAELEESHQKDAAQIEKLESALKAREDGMSELRLQMEKIRTDLETSRRRLGETANDLAIRNRLVDKLSHDLTEKELSLAKALGLIRRLEEDLNRISPSSSSEPVPLKPADPVPVENVAQASEPTPAQPEAEAPPEVVPLEAPAEEQPQAQGAIVDLFKKFTSKFDH